MYVDNSGESRVGRVESISQDGILTIRRVYTDQPRVTDEIPESRVIRGVFYRGENV